MATTLSNSNIIDFIKDSLKFFNLSSLEIAKLLPFIQEEDFSKGQKNKIARLLEYTRRKIEKGFSYSKVKNFLELRDK